MRGIAPMYEGFMIEPSGREKGATPTARSYDLREDPGNLAVGLITVQTMVSAFDILFENR